MNEKLLDWFREHPDQYISGEELSRRLQITRTAVWKQINVLRAKGYAFDAVPKLGYRLVTQPTRLDEAALLSKLAPGTFGNRLRILEKTESTRTKRPPGRRKARPRARSCWRRSRRAAGAARGMSGIRRQARASG